MCIQPYSKLVDAKDQTQLYKKKLSFIFYGDSTNVKNIN